MSKKKKVEPLFTTSAWNFEMLERVMSLLPKYAKELKLEDLYPNQIEIISSDQMLDVCSSSGLPVMYEHWSFGKKLLKEEVNYSKGLTGLAYEIVINTNPCINFLMEENSACTQTLVLCHASQGHNHFFANNYLFKTWSNADSILDYLIYARNFIAKCEERYGKKDVEDVLNIAHSLQYHSMDKCKRQKKTLKHKIDQFNEILEHSKKSYNSTFDILDDNKKSIRDNFVDENTDLSDFTEFPEENLLFFIEEHSKILEKWEKEILNIIQHIQQYFYPQMQTKVMNEGWATFVHYYMMTRLHEDGYLTDGAFLEFLKSHTSVVFQPHNGNWNPYYLGFNLFMDIKRICTEPTEEDRKWFPYIAGCQNWVDVCIDAVKNYRDESFIRQFLSPHLMRKLKMFSIRDDKEDDYLEILHHTNDDYYRDMRKTLADTYLYEEFLPDIQIVKCNLKGSRTLHLCYNIKNDRQLDMSDVIELLTNIYLIWGHQVELRDSKNRFLGGINNNGRFYDEVTK